MIYPTRFSHFGYEWLEKAKYGHRWTLHPGTDFNYGSPNEDDGQPVHAIADGIVNVSQGGSNKGFGDLILIYHPEYKVWSQYAHLKQRMVSVGSEVKMGQAIGKLGGTPYVNGNYKWVPHLHFEIRHKDIPADYWQYTLDKYKVMETHLDPMKYIEKHSTKNEKDSLIQENSDMWNRIDKKKKKSKLDTDIQVLLSKNNDYLRSL